MPVERIDVGQDFSQYPLGRYAKHGPNNGERFREQFLLPALRRGSVVEVDLSHARGLAPSFLEESFGGLARAGYSPDDLSNRLVIQSSADPSLVEEVKGYILDAFRALQKRI
jgi:hypothetical protein